MQKDILELEGEIIKARRMLDKLRLSVEDLNNNYFSNWEEGRDSHYLAYYFDAASTRNEMACDYAVLLNESMKKMKALCNALYASIREEAVA